MKDSILTIDLDMEISGRNFAEHAGVGNPERIDNGPLLLYFSRKNKSFVV